MPLVSLASALLGLACAGGAHAQQVAPSRVTPETLRPAPTTPAPTIELPGTAGPAAPAGATTLSVTVSQVLVEGTFPEFQAGTAQIVGPLRGKRMTVAEIYAVANALERAYAAAGYVLARVVVPPQHLADGGPVRLIIIDGVIERVDLKSVPERQRGIVAARMQGLIGKHHLTLAEIERRLLLVSDIPGISIRSTLAAGSTAGGTLLVLEATQHYVSGTVEFDDRLPRSLGTLSLNNTLALNSALGFGEQIYVSGSTTRLDANPPRLRVFGGGFVAPIGNGGFTINPEYTQSISQPDAARGAPPSEGDFQRAALHASYPLIRTRAETLKLQGTIDWDDETLVPIGFATKLYHDDYIAARLQLDYQFFLPWNAPIDISGTLSQGLTGRDGTTALPLSAQGAGPNFTKGNLNLTIHQPLFNALELDLFGRAQTSFGQPLMLAEQLSLDGTDALSAFASGTFNVDQGATLRAELTRPFLLPNEGTALVFAPYVFGAAGWGDLARPTVVQRKDIDAGSAGIGVRTDASSIGSTIAGSLAAEVAAKFSDVPSERDGYRINFFVNFRF